MKKNNKKGFTMAELLIVVAIIAVLVAIAIPVFTAQLDKSKLATATANGRSMVAEYMTQALADAKTPDITSAKNSCANMSDDLKQGCTYEVSGSFIVVKGTDKAGSNKIPFGMGA